jgi:hypothetical protein
MRSQFAGAVRLCILGCTCACAASAWAQSDLEDLIVGSWGVNRQLSEELMKTEAAEGSELQHLANLRVQFEADGSIKLLVEDRQLDGQWKLVRETEDGRFEVQLIRAGETTPATIEFRNDGSMAIRPARETPLVFSRIEALEQANPPKMPAEDQGAVRPLLELSPLAKIYVGQWQGDAEESRKLAFNATFDAEAIDAMLEQMKSLELDVAADGAFTVKAGLSDQALEMQGTWKPLEENAEEKSLLIDVALKDGPQRKFTVVIFNENRIQMAPENEPAILLLRKPKPVTNNR